MERLRAGARLAQPGRGGAGLAALRSRARLRSNLMPPILEAAEAYATVGEISDRLGWCSANTARRKAFSGRAGDGAYAPAGRAGA